MVGKKSGAALLRDEGLERTDNQMSLTSWPQVPAINQKNYYTEYLKRDDQVLPLRLLQEERRNEMISSAQDTDRKRAPENGSKQDTEMDVDESEEDEEGEEEEEGSKVIIVHPGSQNLRIGLASDALPKTVPMVIAKRWPRNESEENGGEPLPKRLKLEDGSEMEPEKMFGKDFSKHYSRMCSELKTHMRTNKRRVLPNSKEVIINYNKRTPPDTIPVHNDPAQIEWTAIPEDAAQAPPYMCGHRALRIPDSSSPRYKLFWPMKYGWFNEAEYSERRDLFDDFSLIIEDAMINELGLGKKRDWGQYSCVFIIPDLYEKTYVQRALEMVLIDFGFGKASLIQESLAATFGAGFIASCVVDVGAQKTSICCVDEGACNENSRINLKYGGSDVTLAFMKMMLADSFPYAEVNLNRRYDFLLAEELKAKVCTMNEAEISPQLYDFHLRAPNQDTRKYTFKTYDEVLLAPQGYFEPSIFENEGKLQGRRKLVAPSVDVYEGGRNDPTSNAQTDVVNILAPPPVASVATNGDAPQGQSAPPASAPEKKNLNPVAKAVEGDRASVSNAGTPAPEDDDAGAFGAEDKGPGIEQIEPCLRDDVLPIMPLDQAILTSIYYGARGDEKKTREFLGQIMVIGGGASIPGFHGFLETRLKELRPGWFKDILVGTPPREMDPQGVIWKGGSVFGKLKSSSDSWIGRLEYDRLGTRVLAYKCMWQW